LKSYGGGKKMKSNHKKIILLIFGIIIILSIITLSLIIVFKPPYPEKSIIPQYTTSYENVNVSFAKELIETSLNLTIVDCSGGCRDCTWKNGYHLPRAQWIEFPETLYNYTSDILVYCQYGIKSVDFCEQLLNHVYGKIYHLNGGYIAWIKDEELK